MESHSFQLQAGGGLTYLHLGIGRALSMAGANKLLLLLLLLTYVHKQGIFCSGCMQSLGCVLGANKHVRSGGGCLWFLALAVVSVGGSEAGHLAAAAAHLLLPRTL